MQERNHTKGHAPLILIFWHKLPSSYLTQKISNMTKTFHSNGLELLPTEILYSIVKRLDNWVIKGSLVSVG